MPSPIRKIVSSSPRTTLVLAATTTAVLLAISAIVIYQSRAPKVTTINYSQLYQIAEAGSAASLSLESDTLTVQTRQGAALQATVTSDAIRQGLVEQFRKNNVPIEFQPVQTSWSATLLTWGAPLLTVLLLGLIGWRV
jgi:ATP-dependent Zn protease